MNDYFPQDNGIGVRIGNGVKQVLQIIAKRLCLFMDLPEASGMDG